MLVFCFYIIPPHFHLSLRLLFLGWVEESLSGEQHRNNRVHPLGINRWPRPPGSPLSGISVHPPHHFGWGWGDYGSHLHGPPPPHSTHLFLSNLSFVDLVTDQPWRCCTPEQSHLWQRMCRSALSLGDLPPVSASSRPPWPMTTTWWCVGPSTTPTPWPQVCALLTAGS